jgi:hypothetical protein
MRKFLCLALFAGLAGCKSSDDAVSDKNIITYNTFEAVSGWCGDNPSLTIEKAHSGKYSSKVDPAIEFGVTYDQIFGKMTQNKPKKLKVEAWAYVPDKETGKAIIVISLWNAKGEQTFWEGIKLEEVDDYKEWVKVEKEIKLPATLQVTDKFKAFLWRAGATQPVYMDDFKVSLVE